MKFRNLLPGVFAVMLAFGQTAPASAATLYDGSGLNTSFTARFAESAPLAHFSFSQDVELTGISSLIDPSASGNAKFLIFENGVEVFSSRLSFTDTGGFFEISSGPFSFSATAGSDYFIGTILDVAADYSFSIGNDTQGIVTNLSTNGNVTGFATPVLAGGTGGGTIAVSLDGPVSAVPLPAVAPMLLVALGALGLVSTRRSKAVA
ncbi:hypothetical protein KHP62_18795 [Rhodobacteraceae bacterium NNCM2]|nr:hypothetical protein [Coraliihabitans acroporae]